MFQLIESKLILCLSELSLVHNYVCMYKKACEAYSTFHIIQFYINSLFLSI